MAAAHFRQGRRGDVLVHGQDNIRGGVVTIVTVLKEQTVPANALYFTGCYRCYHRYRQENTPETFYKHREVDGIRLLATRYTKYI